MFYVSPIWDIPFFERLGKRRVTIVQFTGGFLTKSKVTAHTIQTSIHVQQTKRPSALTSFGWHVDP